MSQVKTGKVKRKEIRDGKVAVLFSPSHGAGWWTWNSYRGEEQWDSTWLLFDAELVYLVEEKNKYAPTALGYQNWVSLIYEYCNRNYPGMYTGGAEDLEISWLPEGTKFIINEYDGSESIQIIDNINWMTA